MDPDRASLHRRQRAALRQMAEPRALTGAAAGARAAQAQAGASGENGAEVAIWGEAVWDESLWAPEATT